MPRISAPSLTSVTCCRLDRPNCSSAVSPMPVSRRTRYDMVSHPTWRDPSDMSSFDRQRALALPARSNPRSAALAEKMRKAAADDKAYVTAVLAMFRSQNYYYTTTPPLLGTNPVDEFLFTTQAGFCEHYASAFAVLMRAAGVPARVVTGYQGGEINYVGAYLTVRQADAHAWTEVWLKDDGWVRVDPTAAVSPNRVEAGIGAGAPQSESLPRQLRGEYEWLQRTRMTWDSVTNSWNQLVLEYTQERQFQLMQRAGIDNATWQKLATIMFMVAIAITLIVGLFMLRRLHAQRPDPLVAAYARFCAKLRRHGVARHPSEGPGAFSRRAVAAHPKYRDLIENISARYIRLRYGSAADPEETEEFLRSVKAFPAS